MYLASSILLFLFHSYAWLANKSWLHHLLTYLRCLCGSAHARHIMQEILFYAIWICFWFHVEGTSNIDFVLGGYNAALRWTLFYGLPSDISCIFRSPAAFEILMLRSFNAMLLFWSLKLCECALEEINSEYIANEDFTQMALFSELIYDYENSVMNWYTILFLKFIQYGLGYYHAFYAYVGLVEFLTTVGQSLIAYYISGIQPYWICWTCISING